MKTELRECPYCNGSNLEVWGSGDGKYPDLLPSVECKDCGIMQHLSHWNHRPIEDGLQAELKEREALLEHIRDIADEHLKPDLPYETKEEWLRRQLDRIAWLIKNNIKKERE